MRKVLIGLAGMLLTAGVLAAAPCTSGATTLCLNASRFKVEVSWRDSRDRTGAGQAVPITADTGYFWFFSEANIELVVKVLDARSINQKYWVFFGALSSVQYDLIVTDTATGASKTYHNPLGTFASVGDTGAFDPAPPAPRNETVTAEGSQTSPESLEAIQGLIDASVPESGEAFAPCPDTGAFLYLAGCRFRLDVHWSDARGRHGAGTPVQLTNDTGYFWFFAETNVELMVKVLDARSVNGKFWVFFGALSSVEYTINVVDTVSGALRSYHNPQSTFASVGDTSAFRGGYGVTVEPDTARAVSADIVAAAGGSVSTTAADGTVFTLEIPPNSLLVDETVTMTPVSSGSHVPFAGGLAAGVDLQPSGIPLLESATLTIHTPAPISRSEETPVAWNGSGEDFFLFPPLPAAGDLQLQVFHLGGYGVARGTDAERQIQLEREPVGDDDLLGHRISPLLREGRAAAAVNAVPTTPSRFEPKRTAAWDAELQRQLLSEFEALRALMDTNDGDPSGVIYLIRRTEAWVARVERMLGRPLSEISVFAILEIRRLFQKMVTLALRKIHDRCLDDPTAVVQAPAIIDAARRYGIPGVDADIESVFKCLTFQLKVDSTMTITGYGQTVTVQALADVTMHAEGISESYVGYITGEGRIDHGKMSWTGLPPEGNCVITTTHTPSTFRALLYWGADMQIVLPYDPGVPLGTLTATCRYAPAVTQVNSWIYWHNGFRTSAADRGGNGYPYAIHSGWLLIGKKDPWAVRVIIRTGGSGGFSVNEQSVFKLAHTPE